MFRKTHNKEGTPSLTTTFQIGKSVVRVGRFTYGHKDIQIREWGEGASLEIGQFCSIADGVKVLLGGNHRTEYISTFPFGFIFNEYLGEEKVAGHPYSKGDVLIGNDVWVGSGVTILSGVRIGNGAVLASNSVVTKNVGAYEIVGGNPARRIKKRFSQEVISLLEELAWWDLPTEKILEIRKILSDKPKKSTLKALLKERTRKI
jgi:acetyltransferase-like isoleucine patch superfamily enzyme